MIWLKIGVGLSMLMSTIHSFRDEPLEAIDMTLWGILLVLIMMVCREKECNSKPNRAKEKGATYETRTQRGTGTIGKK